ncbi:MAG: HAD family hydrolase [Treponemataceae bacterium]|nr:HAD family hydrolase [Treponemataceae bacterium]
MTCKAAIFDMDGTILDTLDDLTSSVNHSLQTYGFPQRSREEVRSFVGNGMAQLIHLSVPAGTPQTEEKKVLEEHKSYYHLHSADKTKAFQGITELLRSLKAKGLKTAVVSNKGDSDVKALADKYFKSLFDSSIGSREGVPRKPAPDLLDIALKEMGVAKDDAVYIGDSEVDVATAVNSGLRMITVLWGYRTRKELLEKGADNFVDSAEGLRRMLLDPS